MTAPTPATRPALAAGAISLLVLGVIIGLNAASAALGSAISAPHISGWYVEAAKPSWTPANMVFSLVWTVLYLVTSIAAWLVWQQRRRRRVERALTLYVVQLVLNALWSPMFFALYPAIGSTATWLSLTIHMILMATIVATMVEFWPVRRLAAIMMAPYLMWVVFAATLTVGIAVLN